MIENLTDADNKPTLETAGRLGGILIATIYGTGFLIVALHHSQYGISEFSLLRARIFSSGLLFVVLLTLPMVVVSRIFNLFGLKKSLGIAISTEPENLKHLKAGLCFGFYWVSAGLAAVLRFLFSGSGGEKPFLSSVFSFAILVLIIALGWEAKRNFNRYPSKYILASFLVSVLNFTVALLYGDRQVFWLALWFYLIGLATVFVYTTWKDDEERSKMEWEWWGISVAPTMLFVFATHIYGSVAPQYGGGAPLRATMYVSGANPISQSDAIDVLLLEETDHGYYFLRTSADNRGCFLSRNIVVALEFGPPSGQRPLLQPNHGPRSYVFH